jgi:hypothetical protein
MANICNNEFYACSDDPENMKYITSFFEKNFDIYNVWDQNDNYMNLNFESKWAFPQDIMDELAEGIPNKENIFMRCLSVEYGNLYHELLINDGYNWKSV